MGEKMFLSCKDCLCFEACTNYADDVGAGDDWITYWAEECDHRKSRERFVEIVRCKNCEYFEIDKDGIDVLGRCKNDAIATNYGGEIYPKGNDFCSYEKTNNRL